LSARAILSSAGRIDPSKFTFAQPPPGL